MQVVLDDMFSEILDSGNTYQDTLEIWEKRT